LVVDVASPDTLLDQLKIDKDFNCLGEDLPDLGLLIPVDDAVEMLDGLDLVGGGAAGERRVAHAVAPPISSSGR